uniref:MANSC domain containing 4 n=1 Tax=Cyanoderma ruficeps TaxID=181631 RepID=A0A8C3P0K6_9PASS
MAPLLAAAQALLLLALAGESQCFCSPTAFYRNCWIRRFPGLLVDLRESQRRGARLLRGYAETSPQQCSRTCCLLRNVSCNVAVFYHGVIYENRNCLHMSCPALESCILKAGVDVVLYNITTGIDPDLLIFEKLKKSQEPNAHPSASKSERQPSTKSPEWGRCQHLNATTSGSPLLRAPPAAMGHSSPANTPSPSWSLTVQGTEGAARRAETSPADVASAERTSSRWLSSSDKIAHSALSPKPAEVLSHVPTPPRLNSSKQHLNETKGYSGRNSTSDNEAAAWEASALGVWLIPVVLCCSLLCLCCCTVALTAGRCSCRRGHYKPVRTRKNMSRQLIKHDPVRGNL